ncbi:serine carboxypeptidase 2 [Artemisia annua]|uniref:Serine carboxypeptidase 2 n=1 Tax=Artemisia annua TaxID=35608 RepID=A0A2U1QDD9_ARTAN|nr:serine carboxypeptidase 2 [Artemisia annua]
MLYALWMPLSLNGFNFVVEIVSHFACIVPQLNDSVVPVTATRYSIDALNFTTVANWYAWYDNSKVAGWSQIYKGLTFVTVTGAGHMVPLLRPRQALILFKSFFENKAMQRS